MRGTLTIASVLLLTTSSACYGHPEVTLSQGTVRGSTMTSHHDRNISAYRRIPFAKPPIGDLRFKNPVAADSWEGVWDATQETPWCPQMKDGKVVGDEDCLYVNVYTPQLEDRDETKLLPVMVYIFGGKYLLNGNDAATWGPRYILDKDVILVVPNQRLGILGFLSTGDSEAPGNFGLKDNVLALKWVQRNIKYFGGDPDNVTIFGSSSGTISVYLMALSDRVTGLFHKFIMQDGIPVQGPLQHTNRTFYIPHAYKLGDHLQCPTNNSSALISCLREANVSTIVNTDSIFYLWHEEPFYTWGPIDEPDLEGAILTDTPQNLLAAGKLKDLPFIIGLCREEGLHTTASFYANETNFDTVMNDLDNALPPMLRYHDTIYDAAAITSAVKEYYLNDMTANNSVLISNFTDLVSDIGFFYPAEYLIEQQLPRVKSPFYVYTFAYRGTVSYSFRFSRGNDSDWGVAHVDDALYLFPYAPEFLGGLIKNMSETDMKMVDIMTQLWTSFATNGIPTAPNGAEVWEPYSLHKTRLRIGSDSDISLVMQSDPHQEQMQFWKELFTKLTTTAGLSMATTASLFVPLALALIIFSLVIYAIVYSGRRWGGKNSLPKAVGRQTRSTPSRTDSTPIYECLADSNTRYSNY